MPPTSHPCYAGAMIHDLITAIMVTSAAVLASELLSGFGSGSNRALSHMAYLNRLRALYTRWIDWLERWLTPRSLREGDQNSDPESK